MAPTPIPADHAERMRLVRLSLEGLSVGDAFGEQFFHFPELIARRETPPPRWRYTDDTAMAAGVARVLGSHGILDQDELARVFAEEYDAEPHRGYGGSVQGGLRAIHGGMPWREAARLAFPDGSWGNGGAMRVAPVGAYFHDDLERAADAARGSAEITHAHPEGIAGAIAIAVAAAVAVGFGARGRAAREAGSSRVRDRLKTVTTNIVTNIDARREIFGAVLEWTPAGATREGIERAAEFDREALPRSAAAVLGSGERISSPDTVPFVMWSVARHPFDYEEALWNTVAGLGDRDTTCAMVGGIVALSAGGESIPDIWRVSRETPWLPS